MLKYIPQKGDIVWLDFVPYKDCEINTRPALVLSPRNYNIKSGLALFVPITRTIKNYPFEVPIRYDSIKGAILCDQICSLSWKKYRIKKIIPLENRLLEEVIYKIKLFLP